MSKILSIALPKDGDGEVISPVPVGAALAATIIDSLDTAKDHTLNANAQFVEINAVDEGVYMKYGGTAGTADFDEYVPIDSTRRYAVPGGVTVLSFLEQAASATVILIEK